LAILVGKNKSSQIKENRSMAKIADRYLVVDPWAIIEQGFDSGGVGIDFFTRQ
jgi:hypothetical protein